MGLLELIVFLKSGIGIFIIVVVLLCMIMPDFLMPIFAFIVAVLLIIMFIMAFISLLK